MQTLLRFICAFALACTAISAAVGDDAIVIKRATMRSDPSTNHRALLTLQPRTDVELLELTPTNGYYRVRTEEGNEGWVYSRNLEIVASSPSAPAPPPITPSVPTATDASTVHTVISPNWEKPPSKTSTFTGPDGLCGPTGDGGDALTNIRKNRVDAPPAYYHVTWKALQSLPYPAAKKSLAEWTPEQLAQIQPYQGIAVSVVGFFTAIKVEDRGGGESTNCHFTNAEEVDWHMPLVEHEGDSEATSTVVETTPRIRELHPKWTPATLSPWVNSPSPVRISGWTMLDPEHTAHIGKYRSTLWEIHPITKIEVFRDGKWVDADSLP